ncbi:unnamed protein product [Rhizophagus irregularis]|uniref:Uncharacterized protein n=1 Tax=Rhizophagus irregularis TaxID=588596 RepID=A0A2N1NAY7_9GLOM|nr:hypothetical protein RhiirC2_778861 [Rhizophagus irregularis]CAB4386958.1 unnamed protein product [Rhizophagus irregularis]CAB5391165.1 unnamed protein product [Rhizophagus irregularis]
MNLGDLFRGYRRRSEPPILFILKLFIMIIFIACLTAYLSFVIKDVIFDAPIIKTSFINSIFRPPNFIVKSPYNFTITCTEFYFRNGSSDPSSDPKMVDCMSDMTLPDVKYGSIQVYLGAYQPSQDIMFYNFSESNNLYGLTSIMIDLITNDSNYTSDELFQPSFEINAFDSDYDPFTKYIKEKKYYELETTTSGSSFDDTISTMNAYYLVTNQLYQFIYSRKIKEFIIPSWINDFGIIPPSYETKPYIETTLLSSPLPINNIINPNRVSISIRPISRTTQVDKEVRTRTYLNGIGLIGGARGLATAAYALLFGADQLRPWGIVQSYCCGLSRLTRKRFQKTFPIIPFFDTSYTNTKNRDSSNHDLSLAEENELRINNLELFLREYVVDVHYLDGIRNKLVKSGETSNSATDTMNNLNNQAIQI